VLAYDTRATGAGAASVVAERLRAAADAVMPSVELREVDDARATEPLLK
jgi:hypothetical protein